MSGPRCVTCGRGNHAAEMNRVVSSYGVCRAAEMDRLTSPYAVCGERS